MITEYYIVNPTGNITALVVSETNVGKYKNVSLGIMKNHPEVEQVGFVDLSGEYPKLRMAGGEFCGNATISTAALFCKEKDVTAAEVKVSVFGTQDPVTVKIKREHDRYFGETYLSKPISIKIEHFAVRGNSYNLPLARFPGIAHIICEENLGFEINEMILKKYAEEFGVPAIGIMIYDRKNNTICPVVYVGDCDTLIRENSCVSGTIATASYLLTDNDIVNLDIKQPGGVLNVFASKSEPKIKITGTAVIENHYEEEFDYE